MNIFIGVQVFNHGKNVRNAEELNNRRINNELIEVITFKSTAELLADKIKQFY